MKSKKPKEKYGPPRCALATGSPIDRVVNAWRSILHGDGPTNYSASIYHTTPELRDALTELARLSANNFDQPTPVENQKPQ